MDEEIDRMKANKEFDNLASEITGFSLGTFF